jgi:1-pyrroline-5-carboxylate dehydrogenase
LAISFFNFTALGVNLTAALALLGNKLPLKSSSAAYFNFTLMQIYHQAGLLDGVINFSPGLGGEIRPVLLKNPELTGMYFTGSTGVIIGQQPFGGGRVSGCRYHA